MNTTQTRGMASPGTLQALWFLVLCALLNRLAGSGKKKASVELLACARGFLGDSGYIGPVDSPRIRKQLDKLNEAYLSGLVHAMSSGEPPTASLLHELRICLDQTKRQQQVLEASTGHQPLPGGVPFTPH